MSSTSRRENNPKTLADIMESKTFNQVLAAIKNKKEKAEHLRDDGEFILQHSSNPSSNISSRNKGSRVMGQKNKILDSVSSTAQSCSSKNCNNQEVDCPDHQVHGRCLGYHSILDKTLLNNNADISIANLNQTLNGVHDDLGLVPWNSVLKKMPEWMVNSWLQKCPQDCRPNETIHDNPIAEKLTDLVTQSILDQSAMPIPPTQLFSNPRTTTNITSSSKAKQLVANNTLSDLKRVKPGGTNSTQFARVRIQSPAINHEAELSSSIVGCSDSEYIKIENWRIIILGLGRVCLAGRLESTKRLWRTSEVTRAITQNQIITISGQIYTLVGPYHDPRKELPQIILKKFINGFPEDWKKIINVVSKSRQSGFQDDALNQSGEISPSRFVDSPTFVQRKVKPEVNTEQCTLKPPSSRNFKKKTTTYEDSSQSESEKEVEPTPSLIKAKNCSLSEARMSTNNQLKPKEETINMKTTMERTLSRWEPVLLSNGRGVTLRGILIDHKGDIIHSNHISPLVTKRLKAKLLETESGDKYILNGPCTNSSKSIPPKIHQKFIRGFPVHWVAFTQDWHNHLNEAQIVPTQDIQQSDTRRRKQTLSLVTKESREQAPKSERKGKICPEEITSISVVTSSRGRQIVRPLKFWQNEKIMNIGSNLLYRTNTRKHTIITKTPIDKTRASMVGPSKSRHQKASPWGRKFEDILEESLEDDESEEDEVFEKVTTITTIQPKNVYLKVNKIESDDDDDESPVKKPRLGSKKEKKTNVCVKEKENRNQLQREKMPKTASTSMAKKTMKTNATKKKKPNKEPDITEEEHLTLLTEIPKNLRQRIKRDKVLSELEKNAGRDKDFFNDSNDEEEDPDGSNWDAESVNSRMTVNDDDRARYNYTPPGDRINRFLKSCKESSVSSESEEEVFQKTSRDKKALRFLCRRKLTKRTTKKSMGEQPSKPKTSESKTDIQKQKEIDAMHHALTQPSGKSKASGRILPDFKHFPGDSDSSELEEYFPEEEFS